MPPSNSSTISPAQVPVKQTNLFINNKFVPSSTGSTFDTFNPATEEKIASVAQATSADVDAAVAAARAAFEGPWRTMDATQRGRLLYILADLIEKNADELAQLEALDAGKPSFLTKVLDVQACVNVLRYYAGWADKIHGSTISVPGPYLCYTKQEPVGVCGQIIPWNFPLIMLSWKLGPALTTGNTVVLKPAEQTSLTALRVAELIVEAGFPEGVVNIVTGGGGVGAHLAQHPNVDKIAFTGSTATGLKIMRTSHVDNLKRISLELGGKSANIILDDADMDLAIRQSQMGLFLNAGQVCISGSRVYVQEGVYDEFVRRSAEAAQAMKIGDPFDLTTQHGPQIDGTQFKKAMGYIEAGQKDGARLVCGGKQWGSKGYFIEPTVFADVTEDMSIAREEIFGPVMSIIKFKSIDEVIKRANNSEFGLGAGVVTSSVDNALKISNGVRAGTVYVNCYSVIEPNTPFGGFKNSGLGREQGELGLRSYLENKTVIIKRPDDSMPAYLVLFFMSPRKAAAESRRAQVAEAAVLALAGGWITRLVQQEEEEQQLENAASMEAEQKLLQATTMSHVLLILHILGFSAVFWSLSKAQILSKALRTCSRLERDAGLVVGCLLPPLVLLSRLVVGIYQDGEFSNFTFFYAWTSISIGVSVVFKVAVVGSVTSFSVNVLVDAVLLPIAFALLSPVEAEWRFVLATGGRCIVASVLAAGFKFLPRSFTVGEALLVAQGVGLCAFDVVLSTLSRLSEYDLIDLPPSMLHPWLLFSVDREDYILALQVGMLGSLLVA
ncbi:hypothetical protein BBO99_00001180 [Phytophthora kernoviae]|uniref:Aldehyde dehydrogenase domain-containing protein n=1 Tax=Phytophthora kernoviae TaxID=325452 RepID=A0A3R7H879_9STRA|nr:hypothetical protein BBI17_004324 [Phytophthora kernoviae]RLN84603.1 hypothetical protein BBO99_00001180 [Phytophthora kernoviae]